MKVSSNKLMDLVFALGMKILELVEISPYVETIWSQDVWLPFDQMFTFNTRNLTEIYKISSSSSLS